MAFSINTNLSAIDAYNALGKINSDTTKAQFRLATGKKINSVADDTSGYRVGKELQGKVNLMTAAQGNVSSAKDLLATAETALSSINDLLNSIKGKVADASDPAKNLTALASDINALGDEIKSMFTNTKFNDTALLSGTGLPASSNFVFRTGETEMTTVNFGTMNALNLGSITGTGATSTNIVSISVDTIQTAVQNALGKIGNYTQRLDVKEDYLASAISNANASVSRLFDADAAREQLNATKGQILGQVATSMLSQLNSSPQNLLSLFR